MRALRPVCYNPPPRPPCARPLRDNLFGTIRMPIQVDSEIGRLRRVLVHRPGREIDWMVPSMMEGLLFHDILDGDGGRGEHAGFRRVIEAAGVEVLDSQDLLADVLGEEAVRKRLLDELE